ncbi:ABC transporter ATP-binding protein [Candidatus Acetothermia bacterium]|nr:ABC transporter ATP-binding protein [Candidatus Acetothermia bacterium]MBI3644234.1 ABC transporter ATP-binding protein [Candidatus Acetothermia bacterium]
MTQLELRQISKKFGNLTAVDRVSLSVNENELVALVGPSGCGKTTLLRLIAGFEQPDSGQILMGGQNITHLRPEERQVGIVFQDYALFPHMNVKTNVAYGLRFSSSMSTAAKRDRVEEFLQLVGLSELRSRMPEELSAGQQQRVALARTLAPQPRVVLLDEPFSALDQKLRHELRFDLKRLQHALKITMIHVTHDQEEALAIAEQVAVMNQGQIEQIGTPREVYQQPRTTFVARFIGRGNVLQARVVSAENKLLVARLGEDQPIKIAKSSGQSLSSDGQIEILIRPEHVQHGSGFENQLRGTLRGIEFLGEALLLHIEIAGQDVIAKIPVSSAKSEKLTEGQSVIIGFSSNDAAII